MITLKPNFIKIIKPPVSSYILWREMAMVINYGLILCVLMVEVPSAFGLEEEIVVNKGHDK
jgi:hypothetical protein